MIQIDSLDLGELYAYTAIDTFTRQAQVVIRPRPTAARSSRPSALRPPHYALRHRIARPYKKNEQAFIEASNGAQRREEFGRTHFKAGDLGLAQERADAFLEYYHHKRPHMALSMQTPAAFAESQLPCSVLLTPIAH